MKINKHKVIKIIVISVSVITLLLLYVFTWDIINDEPNWAWFDIDFDNEKVSNYGSLISGLLSFLAILFVIYGLADQREQINCEKEDKKVELEQEYYNRIKLLNSLLKNILNEIKLQGERMETFYKNELENLSQTHVMHFSANYSFQRIFEMDTLVNYKSIQYFFQEDSEWEKLFLNLNNMIDFYSESLKEHKEKYINHIKDKVNRQQEVANLCVDFLDIGGKLIEHYRKDYGPEKYLAQSWANAVNEFIPAYYSYVDECSKKQEQTNFRFLSDHFFLKFLKHAMEIRETEEFDNYGSQDLSRIASTIRKKIFEIEMYSKQYGDNIKYYYDEYFCVESNSFKNLEVIKNQIESKILTK